jgi:hypothetical protein
VVSVRGYGVALLCWGEILSLLGDEDVAVVRLEERRKGFAGVVSLSLPCAVWLVATLKVTLRNTGMNNFVKSFQEDQQVLIVCLGENRADCFLELVVYAEGGRQGLTLLPKGREERGWGQGSWVRWWLFLKPWLLPLFLLLLLLLSYDVIGVLVLVGARQEGPCHDVLFCGFCGLVPVRVLGFPPVFGFCGFCFHSFFFLLSFSVLVSFLYA